jgi:hypothetical protein
VKKYKHTHNKTVGLFRPANNTPIPHKGKSPSSGLTTTQFFEVIFKTNEAMPKSKKLTDNMILAEWERQFGAGWPKAEDRQRREFLIARLAKLRDYRKRWNRGELYAKQIVRVVSWRYDAKGVRVDFSDGTTPLTSEKAAEWTRYFRERAGIRWQPYA